MDVRERGFFRDLGGGSGADRAISSRAILGGWLAAVAVLAGVQIVANGAPIFPVDDAYITLHNASVLIAGKDPNFPGISPFAGATSPVHLLLVTGLGLASGVPWALWLSGWLATALLVAGTLRLAIVLEAPLVFTLVAPVLALASGDTPIQLMNGLETGLGMAATMWAFALHLDPAPARRRWLPALIGTMPFLRPELALVGAALLADRALGESGWSARGRRLAHDAGIAALFAAPWLLLNFVTTGGPLPATIAVKHDYFAEGCKPAAWRTSTVLSATNGFLERLGFVSLGFALVAFRRVGRLLLGAAAIFLAGYWAEFPGALTHFEHRYLQALVPISLLGLALAAAARESWMRRAGTLLALFALLGTAFALPATLARYQEHLDEDTRPSELVSRFVVHQLPGRPRLLAHDIGYLSTAVPNEIVDLVGLKNPRAAELHRPVTWGSCGEARGLVVHEIALASGASYLIVLDDWESIYHIARNLRALGWRVDPMRPAGSRYQLYHLTPPLIARRLELTGDGRFTFGPASR